MKPKDQRLAIAIACGWTQIEDFSESLMMPKGSELRGYPPKNPIVGKKEPLPEFLRDLNAIQEAVLKLSEEGQREWMEWIDTILERDFPTVDCDCWGYRLLRISATAAQRSEALIRAIGKWTD